MREEAQTVKFTFVGGAMEPGGSCIHVCLDGHGLLLDAGRLQDEDEETLAEQMQILREAGDVEAVLISHAHPGHISMLPVLIKAYPDVPVFMNQMTADLARCMLPGLKTPDGKMPMYSAEEVNGVLANIRILRFQGTTEILPDIWGTLYPSVHIGGASSIMVQGMEGSVHR